MRGQQLMHQPSTPNIKSKENLSNLPVEESEQGIEDTGTAQFGF